MIYQRIREARKAAGITQDTLAQILGVNRATISKYETGTIDLPVSQLMRIADALGVHVLDLLGVTNQDVGFIASSNDGRMIPNNFVNPLNSDRKKIYTVSSKDGRPVPDDLISFLNSDVKTLFDSLTDEEKLGTISSAFGQIPKQPGIDDSKKLSTLSKSEIIEQIKSIYGETVSDTFSMYVMLDIEDRGEIRGEIKQMLKKDKYLKQEENLA